jgi:predicted nucleic acid-binding protein
MLASEIKGLENDAGRRRHSGRADRHAGSPCRRSGQVARRAQELGRFSKSAISIITWAEVLVGAAPRHEAETRAFLNKFEIVALSLDIAERAVAIRRERRIKLPDAVIWATAQAQGGLLVTRNSKDFPTDDPGIRVPYRR